MAGTISRLLRWWRSRRSLVCLDIYGLERESTRFVICHGDELVENFFAESPVSRYLKRKRAERHGDESC